MQLSEFDKFLILLSNDIPQVSDAIVYLEGDGTGRVGESVRLYQNSYAKKVIFSGGVENLKLGAFPSKHIIPILVSNGIPIEDIIVEGKSKHTREQAIEVIEFLKFKMWNRIILVASHYHQYRAFLTFLQVLMEKKMDRTIRIYNSSAKDLSWYQNENWGTRIELLDDEFEKILAYRKQGHIAQYNEALNYFRWRDSMPV